MDESTVPIPMPPDSERAISQFGQLDHNPAVVYLASLSPGSRRTMRESLDLIARIASRGQADAFTFNWGELRVQHIGAIRSWLAEKYSPATGNKMLSALRGVLRAANDLHLIGADDYTRAVSVRAIPGEALLKGRSLSNGEIRALLEACAKDGSAAGPRDAAMIALMRGGELRRAEVCNLDVDDYDSVQSVVAVRGKLNKKREVPLARDAVAALSDWLKARSEEPGPLFCAIRWTGTVVKDKRLTPQAIYKCLAKRAQEAGVSNIAPHDFRRTFVSELLDAGADISTVQKLAGHANIQTTARYDRRGEAAKRKAVSLLKTPYRRRRSEKRS